MLVGSSQWLIGVYALLISWLSLSSGIEAEPWFPHQDKLMHFIAYLFFTLLCLPQMTSRLSVTVIAVGIFLFAAAMEIGQYFTPNRTLSGLDMLANSLGLGLGVLISLRLRRQPFIRQLFRQK